MDLGWIPSLGIYLLGILVIAYAFKYRLYHTEPSSKDKLDALLQAEHDAQFIRSKALPTECLIQVDFSKYPTVHHTECEKLYQAVMRFSNLPMANLQGQTNLELKQKYGAQTLEQITVYEKNYYGFINATIKYGSILYENGFINEARQTLEQCILYHCDVSKCYTLLIEIYTKQQDQAALESLRSTIKKEMCNSPFLHKVLSML